MEKKRAIDCLIYGTGFVTDPSIYLKSFSCTGLNHLELTDAWKDGAESYYGINTKHFPNLFQLLGPNTVLGHNSVIFMIESQVNYILQLIEMAEKAQSQAIVVKADIQDQFNQHLQSQFTDTIWQSLRQLVSTSGWEEFIFMVQLYMEVLAKNTKSQSCRLSFFKF